MVYAGYDGVLSSSTSLTSDHWAMRGDSGTRDDAPGGLPQSELYMPNYYGRNGVPPSSHGVFYPSSSALQTEADLIGGNTYFTPTLDCPGGGGVDSEIPADFLAQYYFQPLTTHSQPMESHVPSTFGMNSPQTLPGVSNPELPIREISASSTSLSAGASDLLPFCPVITEPRTGARLFLCLLCGESTTMSC